MIHFLNCTSKCYIDFPSSILAKIFDFCFLFHSTLHNIFSLRYLKQHGFLQLWEWHLFTNMLLISLSHTASSPECQLLKQVTRGPWGLPMDPTLRRATDTTAVQLSEMVSLPVLIKHSVTTPLITQWVSDWKEAAGGTVLFCVRQGFKNSHL